MTSLSFSVQGSLLLCLSLATKDPHGETIPNALSKLRQKSVQRAFNDVIKGRSLFVGTFYEKSNELTATLSRKTRRDSHVKIRLQGVKTGELGSANRKVHDQ